MKRSEAVKEAEEILRQGGLITGHIDRIMLFCAKAGITWDAEEEPLAERLKPVQAGCVVTLGTPGQHASTYGREMTMAEATIAAEMYNRQKAISLAARELMASSNMRCWELANLLEGKT
jgi:hypothetical protein